MFQNPAGRGLSRATLPLWQRAGLLCAAFFLCAWLGDFLSPAGGASISYWLPSGLFVAVLLLNPTRDWPWLMLAVLPANIGFDLLHDFHPKPVMLAGFCLANILQAGSGAWLVRRFVAVNPRLSSLKEFFGLIVFSGGIGAATGATIGAVMLTRLHLVSSFTGAWTVLWGGNVMAVLVLAPMILVFGDVRTRPVGRWNRLQSAEAALIFGGMTGYLWLVLGVGRGIDSPKIPVLIFVLWAGLRFGLRGASVMVFLLATVAAYLTTHFVKGLSAAEIANGSYVFTLQVFVAVAAMVGLVPPIVLSERDRTLAKLRDSENRYRSLTEAAFEGVFISAGGRIVDASDQGLKMFGYTRTEMVGMEIIGLVVPEEQARVAEAISTGRETIYGHHLQRKDGSTFYGEAQLRHVQQGGRTLRMTALRDVTRRRRAEELSHLQLQVLEMIANGCPLRETLDTLLRMIEAQSPEMLCSILLLDEDGVHLRHGAAPSLPAEFMRAIDGRAIGPAAGSCGTAAFRREPVFVADIASDPLWLDYKQLALPHGLRACWSTPIMDAQRRVLGTFAIYYRQPGLPDERHQQLIAMATHTAVVCLSKHHTEAEREQSIAREQQSRIEYTFQLIASQEAERKRIATELHDSLGQNLLLIKNLAQMALREQEPAQTYERVASINHLATQCIAETRQISRDLHPHQLDHLGLRRALGSMLESVAQATEIKFQWKLDDVDELFAAEAAMNLYRIVQESLNNILKHSRAKNARVELERDIHEVQLRITDDGRGFVADHPVENKKGLGLKHIPERVRMLGGKLKVDSGPGRGTRIEVVIPIATGPE
jgi:PAS domain S-box-containing protein